MCGRYYLADLDEEEVKEYYKALEDLDRKIKESAYDVKVKMQGEIFPSDIVPVVANNKNMQISAFPMEWGYNLNNGNRVINARSETASEKWMFKDGMLQRRCLIPASYYFEWEKQPSGKVKHSLNPVGRKSFFMAGIYRIEKGKSFPVFSILTRDAAPDIAYIHHRMPVILPRDIQSKWLNTDVNANEIIKSADLNMEHRSA